MQVKARHIVSHNKRRYQGLYRNHMEEVIKFFETHHKRKSPKAMRNEKLVHSLLVHLKSKEPPMASSISLFLLPLLLLLSHASASTVIFYNKCTYTVWPGIQASSGQPLLAGGGFKLSPKRAYTLQLPSLWSGRFWGRHGCSFDRSGRGRCATGDCGGSLLCNGAGGVPPATLAEITLGHDQDFYDVSLVDGYNLAMSIMPVKGTGKCTYAGCVSDLNRMCPVGLQVRSRDGKQVVACKSACSAFNSPRYCCTGSFGNPQTCRPTAYSKIFKVACPKAYSYAYDDPTSIATCTKANYVVTFCPHRGR